MALRPGGIMYLVEEPEEVESDDKERGVSGVLCNEAGEASLETCDASRHGEEEETGTNIGKLGAECETTGVTVRIDGVEETL